MKIGKDIKYIILIATSFFIISLFYCLTIFSRLKNSEFLFVHDQNIFFSLGDISRLSFIKNQASGSVDNGIQLIMSLPNIFFYSFFLKLGFSLKAIEMCMLILNSNLLFFLSFIGFYKIYSVETQTKYAVYDWLNLTLITLFYMFSMNLIQLLNTGLFWSIGIVISYSTIPLVFFGFNRVFNEKILNSKTIIKIALVFFMSSLYIPFFAPLVILLLPYSLIKIAIVNRIKLQSIFYLIVLFIFLFSCSILAYYVSFAFGSASSSKINLINGTAGLQQKGVLGMYLSYFSWIIYTPWEPRNIYTFSKYYLGQFYTSVILSIYIVFSYFILSSKGLLKKCLPYIFLLSFSIYLAKGPQPPFGQIYNFLINFNTVFTVIRSPDSKFGGIIIFSLAIVYLYILQYKPRSILLKVYLLFALFVISFPVFTGEAILGKKVSKNNGNYTTFISPEYSEVSRILNTEDSLSNVLSYPEISYLPLIEKDNLFIGQNKLEKLSKLPFIYNDAGNSPFSDLLSKITDFYDFSDSSNLNIKYFIINKNLWNQDINIINNYRSNLVKQIKVKKLVDNSILELYRNDDISFQPRLSLKSETIKMTFRNISPVKYIISIDNITEQTDLIFLESFSENWQLYYEDQPLADDNYISNYISDVKYLFKTPIFKSTHKSAYDYANSWSINKINNKTKYNLILFHKNQSVFNIGFITSTVTFLICIIYLIISKKDNEE